MAPWAQVWLLLLFATILDLITGPSISAAAFYIFPIGLAGWRIGGRTVSTIAIAAIVLNGLTIVLEINPHRFTNALLASQMLDAIVYGAVAFLSTHLRQGQQQLKEQSEQVEQLRRQMAEEMRAARTLQELLFLPPPDHPSVEIGTFMAAARILGGDALDVALLGSRLAVLVADVSGKGSPAALATAILLGMLEDCPDRFESPARTLTFLNKRLGNRLPDDLFVTALYLLMNLETGDVTWASAGHEPPLLLRENSGPSPVRVVQELASESGIGSVALAILDASISIPYEEHRFTLEPGDVLFCYTDGLTDLRLPSKERLGMARLQALFAKFAHLPCGDLIPEMLFEATGKSSEQLSTGVLDDDVTIIAFRKK